MAEQQSDEDLIGLSHVHIEPNNCVLEEPINLAMDFDLRAHAGELRDTFWEVKFIADQTNKRKIVGADFFPNTTMNHNFVLLHTLLQQTLL